jgi:nucleoside-diphosphate-sugar epimerase
LATLIALIDSWKSGAFTGMVARAADFYGPDTRNGMANILVMDPLSKKKASWLVNDTVPHSYTYTPDAAQSVLKLAEWTTA